MANYNELKEYIDARVIPHNNAQRITGQGLNDSLHEMVDSVNDTKQDTIGDLEDIRGGAEKGATSVQMVNHVRPDADGNVDVQGGGGGTTNYNELDNKPSIAGVTLQGNKSLSALGIASESALAGKQDTISDLASIRSGAAKGETALQSVPSEYVKQSQMTTALAGKQDTISDLATIRSGASAGATALQPSALNDYYNKTTIDGKLADKADVTALAVKADKTGLATSIPASGCLPNVLYLVSITGDTAITLVGGISETSVEEFHLILSVTGSPTISWTGVQTWIGGAPDLSDGTFEVSVLAGIGIVAKIA